MLLVDTTYIFSAGGKTLLKTFLIELSKSKIEFEILIDKRLYNSGFLNEINLKDNYFVIKKNEIFRLFFYLWNSKKYNSIFCFSNIPPPFWLPNKNIIIYFHNLFYIKSNKSKLHYWKTFYFKILFHSKYKWFVQSKYVKNELSRYNFFKKDNIYILPFFENKKIEMGVNESENIKYTYIADSSPHKNHIFLIKTWILFFDNIKDKKNVELHLTVEGGDTELHNILSNRELLNTYNIHNHGIISHDKVYNLLQQSYYLLYVSDFESFGLPLIEAFQAGCKIIAPDLIYVKEIIIPTLFFKSKDYESLLYCLNITYNNPNLNDSNLIIENKIDSILNHFSYV